MLRNCVLGRCMAFHLLSSARYAYCDGITVLERCARRNPIYLLSLLDTAQAIIVVYLPVTGRMRSALTGHDDVWALSICHGVRYAVSSVVERDLLMAELVRVNECACRSEGSQRGKSFTRTRGALI